MAFCNGRAVARANYKCCGQDSYFTGRRSVCVILREAVPSRQAEGAGADGTGRQEQPYTSRQLHPERPHVGCLKSAKEELFSPRMPTEPQLRASVSSRELVYQHTAAKKYKMYVYFTVNTFQSTRFHR